MKTLSGKEIAVIAFNYFRFQTDSGVAALKMADAIINNKEYILLGLGDTDWSIQGVLEGIAGNGSAVTNAVGYFAKFYLNKEYEVDEESLTKYKDFFVKQTN